MTHGALREFKEAERRQQRRTISEQGIHNLKTFALMHPRKEIRHPKRNQHCTKIQYKINEARYKFNNYQSLLLLPNAVAMSPN